MARFLSALLLVSTSINTATAIYQQAQDYSGDTFFDGFNFFTGADPTAGFVQFRDQSTATSAGLIKVENSGSTKQVYMGVDKDNVTPNGRPSIRVESKINYNHGLVIADIAHAPGGVCGSWPAFWMLGEDPWPANGEIDIVEGVNDQVTNAMTLHTSAGVVLETGTSLTQSITGTLETSNCESSLTENVGCTIKDDSDLSFGAGFNDIGGGVYATEWTSDFIKIWFFPRSKIPADIQSGKPVPSTAWGTPSSLFTGNFDIDTHFKDLRIIFDTTFCGDYAGKVFSDSPTCAAKAATCNDFVQNNPSAFVDAYWLVNYVKVFEDDGKAGSNTTSSTTSAGSSSTRTSLSSTSSATKSLSSNSTTIRTSLATSTLLSASFPNATATATTSSTASLISHSTVIITSKTTLTTSVLTTNVALSSQSISPATPASSTTRSHGGRVMGTPLVWGYQPSPTPAAKKRSGGAVIPQL